MLDLSKPSIFKLVPLAATYAAATAGALWSAQVSLPNDDEYAVVGIVLNSTKAQANSISNFSVGDGSILRLPSSSTGFIIDAIGQADLSGWYFFPGPVRLPGLPGYGVAPLCAQRNSIVTLNGVLTVPGASLQFSSDVNAADISLVLINQRYLDAQAKRIRPIIAAIQATTAAAIASGISQVIGTSQFGGPITFTRYQIRRTKVEVGSEAAMSLTPTLCVAFTPGNRGGFRIPYNGRVAAFLLGGNATENNAGLPDPVMRMDIFDGEQISLDWSDAATGTADDVRTDHVLLGYEVRPTK